MRSLPTVLRLHHTLLLVVCFILSFAVHIMTMFGITGALHWTPPVDGDPAVIVSLVTPPSKQQQFTSLEAPSGESESEIQNNAPGSFSPPVTVDSDKEPDKPLLVPVQAQPTTPPVAPSSVTPADGDIHAEVSFPEPAPSAPVYNRSHLRQADEFLPSASEKLTYRITLMGIPVGDAELDARQEKGELTLSLRVDSNPFISTLYPVHNVIETRHVNGNYIVTRISQREGSFASDTGFTLFLQDKQVFWINLTTNKSSKETVPTSEVLDTLSGVYFLRHQPLTVGETTKLHIYDSETYEEVPVEILRQESITVMGHGEINTLVIRPLQRTPGIFRRTGNVLIWLTDDANRVPVKIVTTISLGTVTAELVSAESTPRTQHATEK